MLTIPDKLKLDMHLETGGVFLALPHLYLSVAMIRCLSQTYPVWLRSPHTGQRPRAPARQLQQVGCEFRTRGELPTTVARQILKALKAGKIVGWNGRPYPEITCHAVDKTKDVVRVTGFIVAGGVRQLIALRCKGAGLILPVCNANRRALTFHRKRNLRHRRTSSPPLRVVSWKASSRCIQTEWAFRSISTGPRACKTCGRATTQNASVQRNADIAHIPQVMNSKRL
jgi:hypothetical protein